MDSELSNNVFEWLLADWSGHGDNPEALFPSLQDVNCNELASELAEAMRNAGITP